jgi:hypothetical protein
MSPLEIRFNRIHLHPATLLQPQLEIPAASTMEHVLLLILLLAALYLPCSTPNPTTAVGTHLR